MHTGGSTDCQDTLEDDVCELLYVLHCGSHTIAHTHTLCRALDSYCNDRFVVNGTNVRTELCRRSCGTCAYEAHAPAFNLASSCADIEAPGVDCKQWAADGLCAPGNLWNQLSIGLGWCRATCQTCSTKPDCLNQSEQCLALAAAGYCQADLAYETADNKTVLIVDELCPNTCGNPRCHGEDAKALAAPLYCYDRHPNCTDLVDPDDVEASCGGSFFDLAVDSYCALNM